MRLLGLVVVAGLGAAGCNAVVGVTRCDFREEEHPPRCQERDGPMGGAFLAMCRFTKGTPGEGECSREDLVAGCRSNEGGAQEVTDWYYRYDVTGPEALRTREDVKLLCDEDGTELVDP